jgi:TPR repeat protein
MKILAFLLFISTAVVAQSPPKDSARDAFMRHDFKTALALLQPLADAGKGTALVNIGNIYGNGWGVPKDEVKALEYWRRATDKHVPEAFSNVAECYMNGRCGVTADQVEGIRWHIKAAEHRYISSMLTVSTLYNRGLGVPMDKAHALAWADLATANSASAPEEAMARMVLSQALEGATKRDRRSAKKLANELIPIIDENIRLYKAGLVVSGDGS